MTRAGSLSVNGTLNPASPSKIRAILVGQSECVCLWPCQNRERIAFSDFYFCVSFLRMCVHVQRSLCIRSFRLFKPVVSLSGHPLPPSARTQTICHCHKFSRSLSLSLFPFLLSLLSLNEHIHLPRLWNYSGYGSLRAILINSSKFVFPKKCINVLWNWWKSTEFYFLFGREIKNYYFFPNQNISLSFVTNF